MKNYLAYELQRNHDNKHLYEELLKRAQKGCAVLVAHHITFTPAGEEDGNEIPSADTLLFDHEIMQAVFGEAAGPIMVALVLAPVEKRDQRLQEYLQDLKDAEVA